MQTAGRFGSQLRECYARLGLWVGESASENRESHQQGQLRHICPVLPGAAPAPPANVSVIQPERPGEPVGGTCLTREGSGASSLGRGSRVTLGQCLGALSLAYARPCPSCDQESGCHELFAQSSCRWVVIQKCSSHPHEDPGPWATRDRQEPWGLAQPLSLLGDSALLGVWGDLRAQPFFSFSSLFFSCSLFSSLRGLITAQTFNSDGN